MKKNTSELVSRVWNCEIVICEHILSLVLYIPGLRVTCFLSRVGVCILLLPRVLAIIPLEIISNHTNILWTQTWMNQERCHCGELGIVWSILIFGGLFPLFWGAILIDPLCTGINCIIFLLSHYLTILQDCINRIVTLESMGKWLLFDFVNLVALQLVTMNKPQ